MSSEKIEAPTAEQLIAAVKATNGAAKIEDVIRELGAENTSETQVYRAVRDATARGSLRLDSDMHLVVAEKTPST